MITEHLSYIKNVANRFGFSVDEIEEGFGYILVSHRIAPDMNPDYKLAAEFSKALVSGNSNLTCDVEYVDEWSMVNIKEKK